MRDRQVKEDLEFLTIFEQLARALQEVSILKMQAVQKFVIESRIFHDGLAGAYNEVRSSNLYDPMKAKMALQPTKESVVVLLSANATMYGSLSDEVYRDFKEYLGKNKGDDVIIMGKIGRDKFNADEAIRKEHLYYDLEEVTRVYTSLLKMVTELIYYKKITVFYGKFENVFSQKPAMRVIPGNILSEIVGETTTLTLDKLFTLEPSSEELEAFFAHQILGLLFRQSVFEFELARHAARISSLEKSLGNTEDQKRKTVLLLNKIRRTKDTGGIARTIAFARRRK